MPMKTTPRTGWSASAARAGAARGSPRSPGCGCRPGGPSRRSRSQRAARLRAHAERVLGRRQRLQPSRALPAALAGSGILRIGQRNAHRFDGVAVVRSEQVLDEAVGGDPTLPGSPNRAKPPRARWRPPSGVRQPAHGARRHAPATLVAVDAGKHPLDQLAAHAEGGERLAHFAAVEIAEVQEHRRPPKVAHGRHGPCATAGGRAIGRSVETRVLFVADVGVDNPRVWVAGLTALSAVSALLLWRGRAKPGDTTARRRPRP